MRNTFVLILFVITTVQGRDLQTEKKSPDPRQIKHEGQNLQCGKWSRLLANFGLGAGVGGGILAFGLHREYFTEDGLLNPLDVSRTEETLTKIETGKFPHRLPVNLASVRKNAMNRRPKIVLLGERHDCPRCLASVERQREGQKDGNYLFAEEGACESIKTDNIYGLEEPATRLLAFTLFYFHPEEDFSKEMGTEFVWEITRNAEHGEAVWKALKEELARTPEFQKHPLSKEFVKTIDAAFKIADEFAREAFLSEKITEPMLPMLYLLPPLSLLYQVTHLPQNLKKDFPDMMKLKSIKTQKDLTTPENKRLILQAMIELRDQSMARSVLKLYSENAGPAAKDVRVRIGAMHLPGMYAYLRKSLDDAGGANIEITADPEFLSFRKLKKHATYALQKKVVERINANEAKRHSNK